MLNELEILVKEKNRIKIENDRVVSISLSNREDIDDTALMTLANFIDTRELFLGGTHITDKGLKAITGLKDLTYLELSDTLITDAGLKIVEGFKKLTFLLLYGCSITDRSVSSLLVLPHLKSVGLDETQMSREGITMLMKTFPELDVT